MSPGDAVVIERYGKAGRQPKNTQPERLPGTIVKKNGTWIVVAIATGRVWVHKKRITLAVQEPQLG